MTNANTTFDSAEATGRKFAKAIRRHDHGALEAFKASHGDEVTTDLLARRFDHTRP